MRYAFAAVVIALLLGTGALVQSPVHAQTLTSSPNHVLLITSAHENADHTLATFPLYNGVSHGKPTYFIITDASDSTVAKALGVNYAPKLRNAIGTAAVQPVQFVGYHSDADAMRHLDGLALSIPHTVDFTPQHSIVAGPTGFPPSQAQPGAVGEAGYTPLLLLPNGVVLNAPQVANDTGRADKVVSLNIAEHRVVYRETEGFYDHLPVYYASFDSSDTMAAAIEDVTYAPSLNAAPIPGDESEQSAREGLIAFTNGQTGVDNPQRQGLNSTLLDHRDPLNILHEIPPESNDYSPLWEPRFAQWTPAAIAAGDNLRQTDFDDVLNLVQQGKITGFGNTPFGPEGFIITCPPISRDE